MSLDPEIAAMIEGNPILAGVLVQMDDAISELELLDHDSLAHLVKAGLVRSVLLAGETGEPTERLETTLQLCCEDIQMLTRKE